MKKLIMMMALLVGLGPVSFANDISAADLKLKINNGFELELRHESGQVLGVAQVTPEGWTGEEITNYVARFKAGSLVLDGEVYALEDQFDCAYQSATQQFVGFDAQGQVQQLSATQQRQAQAVGGQFATGYKGKIEKFKTSSGKETPRLVFRNSQGQFITWVNIGTRINEGWNRDAAQGWVYEVRYGTGMGTLSGTWINKASLTPQLYDEDGEKNPAAFMCYENLKCPSLAIRDTKDGRNNGKFLTVSPGVFYSSSNQCIYYPQRTLDARDAHKRLASLTEAQAEEICEE